MMELCSIGGGASNPRYPSGLKGSGGGITIPDRHPHPTWVGCGSRAGEEDALAMGPN